MSKRAPQKKQQRLALVKDKVLLGVDISKKKHWARFQYPDGSLGKPFPIENHGKGLLTFWDRLLQTLEKEGFGVEELVVGMEPTGVYWKPLAYFLDARGVQLVSINPQKTKIARELDDSSPEKSDRKDTRLIVELMARGTFEPMYLPKGVYAQLRQLGTHREQLNKMLRQQKSYGLSLLDQLFPEWVQVFKDPWIKSSKALLTSFSIPQHLLEADEQELIDLLDKIASNKKRSWSEAKIQALRELAKTSAGVIEPAPALASSLCLLLRIMEDIEQKLEELEQDMVKLLRKLPRTDNLLTFKELGELGLAGLIGEMGELERYDHAGQMESMAGFNLYQETSGQQEEDESKIKRKITKRGRPKLRKILYYIALRCVKKDGCFRSYYMRLIQNGKRKEKALIAVCRKVLRVLFALVKQGGTFERERHTN